MNGPLRSASRKCEDALRVEQETQLARKRVAPPSHNERDAKRHKMGPQINCDAGEKSIQQRQMDNMEDCPKGKEISTPQRDLQCSKVALPDISASEKNGEGKEEFSKYRYLDTNVNSSGEETIQQGQVNSEEDYPKGNKISSPQNNLRYSEVALPDTSAFDKDRESPEKYSQYRDLSTEPAEGKLPSMAMTSTCGRLDGKTDIMPTRFQIESGLSNGSLTIEAFVKAYLRNLKRSTIRTNFNVDNEIEKIWSTILLLKFFQIKPELHNHLESREKVRGHQLQTLIDWNTTDLGEILDALKNVKRSTIDNKIHRAYGQTILVSSVDAQIARGYKYTVAGQRFDYVAIMIHEGTRL